jgi:hypothetical protein
MFNFLKKKRKESKVETEIKVVETNDILMEISKDIKDLRDEFKINYELMCKQIDETHQYLVEHNMLLNNHEQRITRLENKAGEK